MDFYVRILGGKAVTCVIPTATSSRSANMLKSPSIGSSNALNLARDQREDVRYGWASLFATLAPAGTT
jgi:hypothetical protein